MNYSDDEPRIHVETGQQVQIIGRGRDEQGTYVEIRFSSGDTKRVHPSRLRPLTWRKT